MQADAALPTLLMMSAEPMLSKCQVLRFTVAIFFLLTFEGLIPSKIYFDQLPTIVR